jgi:hypothetical protein
VAVLHASYRLTALRAQEAGNEAAAKQPGAKADELDLALLGIEREAIAWLEAKATYTRTGPGGCGWRDGAGLVSALFLYHVSRAGNPDLRVHAVILNRVQRADGADGTWRALAGEQLSDQRPSVTAIANLPKPVPAPVTGRRRKEKPAMTGSAMCPARTSARAVIVPESAPQASRHGCRKIWPTARHSRWSGRPSSRHVSAIRLGQKSASIQGSSRKNKPL